MCIAETQFGSSNKDFSKSCLKKYGELTFIGFMLSPGILSSFVMSKPMVIPLIHVSIHGEKFLVREKSLDEQISA